MDIHEYQAKDILARFGVPAPRGGLAYSPEQAAYRAREIGGNRWIVKAQVHTAAAARPAASSCAAARTRSRRQPTSCSASGWSRSRPGPPARWSIASMSRRRSPSSAEIYLGFVLDRVSERVMVVASSAAAWRSRRLPSGHRNRSSGPWSSRRWECRHSRRARSPSGSASTHARQEAVEAILGAYKAFEDLDATMVEINPLVITEDGRVLALDAKMTFDDNALFRRPNVAELRDKSQEDPRETRAADRGLAYVGLDGNIGCIVNGAGLAMATMDMIKLRAESRPTSSTSGAAPRPSG